MADTKDETTVDNTELNEQETAEDTIEETEERVIDPNLTGIQLFFEKNKKAITYVGGGLVLLIAAVVYWNFIYLPEKEKEASNEAMWAQKFFDIDSFKVALNGGVNVYTADGQKMVMGFEQISDEYSMTKIGNLANYYSGICYLRTGKYEEAIAKLQNYSLNDEIIAPMAYGAIGDANMELNKIDEAIKYYLKAADKNSNTFTTPYFLKKASFAYEQKASFQEAIEIQQRLDKEYGKTEIGKNASREIARLTALAGL